jgi:hypothetical protein
MTPIATMKAGLRAVSGKFGRTKTMEGVISLTMRALPARSGMQMPSLRI